MWLCLINVLAGHVARMEESRECSISVEGDNLEDRKVDGEDDNIKVYRIEIGWKGMA